MIESWSLARRVAFRFAFAYFALYAFPSPLDSIPYLSSAGELVSNFWNVVVPWTGANVLHLAAPITIFPNGSGDTTFNYVELVCFAALAVVATIVWSILDRKRTNYTRLADVLIVYLRIVLGAAMIGYGSYKIVPSQFPQPPVDRLVSSVGAMSPMGLLWTFMGASPAYEMFAGALEFIGGVLLFTRRTALIGALVSAGVLANVVALNYCYDVPVKLYSMHLLAMAIAIALPHARTLIDLVVLRRAVQPIALGRLFERAWLHRAAIGVRTLLLVTCAWSSLAASVEQRNSIAKSSTANALDGTWTVEEFTLDGVEHPSLTTDLQRWHRVSFASDDFVVLRRMDETVEYFHAKIDLDKKTADLTKSSDAKWSAALTFEMIGAEQMSLAGTFGGAAVQAKLRRVDASKFLLTSRGFHWINEYPFNR